MVRIDNDTPADAIQPIIFADGTGTKLFVVGPAPMNQGRVVVTTGATTTVGAVDSGITAVDVAKDDSAVVFTAGGALKKATFAAAPAASPAACSSCSG